MEMRWLARAATCLAVAVVLVAALGRPAMLSAEDGAWLGEYYTNRWLAGSPSVVREDAAIDFDWGHGSPDDRIPADEFSVRWSRNVAFEAGTYRFSTKSDDGVRLYVDGSLIIDRWYDMHGTSHSAEIHLDAGTHAVRLEYYENHGGARVRLSWDEDETERPIGNIITCVRPANSWIKIYRWDGSTWVDVNPHGYGPLSASGYLKLDGMAVDANLSEDAGNPYRVELWAGGSLVRAIGDTAAGQGVFRVYAYTDAYTPWACPAP